jgi:hypothetical protein
MTIRDNFVSKEPETLPASPARDCLFAPYWSGLIDARLTERDRELLTRFSYHTLD